MTTKHYRRRVENSKSAEAKRIQFLVFATHRWKMLLVTRTLPDALSLKKITLIRSYNITVQTTACIQPTLLFKFCYRAIIKNNALKLYFIHIHTIINTFSVYFKYHTHLQRRVLMVHDKTNQPVNLSNAIS